MTDHIHDQIVKNFVTLWFWPYFVMGNYDDWQKLGVTLNGIRPVNLCQTDQTKKSQPQIT
jgi:hypothetical protein